MGFRQDAFWYGFGTAFALFPAPVAPMRVSLLTQEQIIERAWAMTVAAMQQAVAEIARGIEDGNQKPQERPALSQGKAAT